MYRMTLVAVVAALVCSVAAGDTCDGNVCFVQEGGTGACTEAEPCSIDTGLDMVGDGGTVFVKGLVTVSSTLVLSAEDMLLEGYLDEAEDAGLSCSVPDGPCILVQGAGATIQGLVLSGTCEGTCVAVEAQSLDTTHTLQLVAFQEITVSAVDDAASLVRLAGSEALLLHRSLVQECSFSGTTASVLLKEAAAAASAVSVENIFIYGKLDPGHDGPLLSSLPSVVNTGPLTLKEFSIHGLDVGSVSLLNGLEGSQVFVANGTINEVNAHGLISLELGEHGRFLVHELEFTNCVFTSAMHLVGASSHPADVYLDEVEMTRNIGCMLEATEANVIISSLTARENAEFSIVVSGSSSITNSVISYNSNLEGAMLQITGIDSRSFAAPTPAEMIYISSCDFASNRNTALEISTVPGDDPRGSGVIVTTCTFLDNASSTEASAVALNLADSVVAQLIYIGVSDNTAADDGAAVYCSSTAAEDPASLSLIVATFANNAPADIGGSCSVTCSDIDGPSDCPMQPSQSSSSSSTIVLFVFAFVLVAIPATIGACVAQRYIAARRNREMEDNLAANDDVFELEEYPHND